MTRAGKFPTGHGWVSYDEAVVSPSRFAVALEASRALVCFSDACLAALEEAFGLQQDVPRAAGSQHGKGLGDLVAYRASFGAPAAGMLVETLIASGIRQIVMLGMAGALARECSIGDVIIPTWGIREEGTSHHYYPAGVEVGASQRLSREIGRWLAAEEITYQEGGVWTTDAPFRETRRKVTEYAGRGVLAVEMECTALMAISMYRGIDFGAVLLISDELFHDEWQEGFRGKTLQATRVAVCRALAQGWARV